VLVYPNAAGDPTIPLTRRRHDLRSHPGEVSLPGGAVDATDATPEAAALREASEEIGLDAARVEVVGRLDEVWIPASNYDIVPVVATAAERPSLHPADAEVAAILEVPLRALLAGALVDEDEFSVRGMRLRAAFYRYQDDRVWGATARILSMLVAVLR
jgi:8-oxo-dGTP pyrophosphatase MutT (NUDIX family)